MDKKRAIALSYSVYCLNEILSSNNAPSKLDIVWKIDEMYITGDFFELENAKYPIESKKFSPTFVKRKTTPFGNGEINSVFTSARLRLYDLFNSPMAKPQDWLDNKDALFEYLINQINALQLENFDEPRNFLIYNPRFLGSNNFDRLDFLNINGSTVEPVSLILKS